MKVLVSTLMLISDVDSQSLVFDHQRIPTLSSTIASGPHSGCLQARCHLHAMFCILYVLVVLLVLYSLLYHEFSFRVMAYYYSLSIPWIPT